MNFSDEPYKYIIHHRPHVPNLSVQPDAIYQVRQAISKLNVAGLRTILPALFDLESADEVELKIKAFGI